MAIVVPDMACLREPNLLVPGKKPVGPVEIDFSVPGTEHINQFLLAPTAGRRVYDKKAPGRIYKVLGSPNYVVFPPYGEAIQTLDGASGCLQIGSNPDYFSYSNEFYFGFIGKIFNSVTNSRFIHARMIGIRNNNAGNTLIFSIQTDAFSNEQQYSLDASAALASSKGWAVWAIYKPANSKTLSLFCNGEQFGKSGTYTGTWPSTGNTYWRIGWDSTLSAKNEVGAMFNFNSRDAAEELLLNDHYQFLKPAGT